MEETCQIADLRVWNELEPLTAHITESIHWNYALNVKFILLISPIQPSCRTPGIRSIHPIQFITNCCLSPNACHPIIRMRQKRTKSRQDTATDEFVKAPDSMIR